MPSVAREVWMTSVVVGPVDGEKQLAGAELARLQAGHDVLLVVPGAGDKEIGLADVLLLEQAQ